MALHGAATPGVYQMAKSLKARTVRLGWSWLVNKRVKRTWHHRKVKWLLLTTASTVGFH